MTCWAVEYRSRRGTKWRFRCAYASKRVATAKKLDLEAITAEPYPLMVYRVVRYVRVEPKP